MEYISLPIPDRQAPPSQSAVATTLEEINADLSAGKNVVIHCRQGIGRSGLVGACLLITKGVSAGSAVDSVSAARGLPVPETEEQRLWIERYAAALAGAK
jgi:protein-tyrosine phosphatase